MVFRETMVELVSGEGEVIPTNIVGCLITGDDPLLRVRRGLQVDIDDLLVE